jgi:hypothetical protein
MTSTQYREAIARVGLSQVRSGFFVDAGERTGSRWAADGPPGSMAKLLRLMIALGLSAVDVDDLLAGKLRVRVEKSESK